MISNTDDDDAPDLRAADGSLASKKGIRKAARRAARDALRAYLAGTGIRYETFSGALLVLCEGPNLSVRVVSKSAEPLDADAGQTAYTLWRTLVSLAESKCDELAGIHARVTMSDGRVLGIKSEHRETMAALVEAGQKSGDLEPIGRWIEANAVPVAKLPALGASTAFLQACVAAMAEGGQPRPDGIDALATGLDALVASAHAAAAKQAEDKGPPKLRLA